MIAIGQATDAEREWCAQLMAGSDPWITLGRWLEQCRAACRHPEYLLLVAHAGQEPCGFVLLHPRGVGALLLAHAEAHFAARAPYLPVRVVFQ
jgi:hypothetical protein